MAQRSKFTRPRIKRFLKELSKSDNASAASQIAGWSRTASYEYKRDNPEFSRQWEEAHDKATDSLEAEARRRATGADTPIYYKGVKVGSKLEYSDPLLMFMLRGNRAKYRENQPPQLLTGPPVVNNLVLARQVSLILRVAKEELDSKPLLIKEIEED